MTSASPAHRPWTHRVARLSWRIGRSLLIMYLLVILVFSLLQTQLIFPGASSQGQPESTVTPPPGAQLLTLHAPDATPIAALFGPAITPTGNSDPAAPSRPTLLWFYGNAMCMNDALLEFHQFRSLGLNVMLVDYEGFGMSGGTPGEQGCYAAAEAGYQHLLSRSDINPNALISGGWSLGGAVAIDLAHRHAAEHHIAALMTFCTFTSMREVAAAHFPGFPIRLFLRHRFNSAEKLRDGIGKIPALLGHGTEDPVVPFAMHARLVQAAESSGSPVQQLILPHAGHNDFFDTGEDAIDAAVRTFLQPLLGK